MRGTRRIPANRLCKTIVWSVGAAGVSDGVPMCALTAYPEDAYYGLYEYI